MKQLFAPWRLPYLMGEKEIGCVLCEKAKEKKDRANLVLYRGEHAFVMLNLYPYNNGHLMVCPYLHVSALSQLSEPALNNLIALVQKSEIALQKSSKPTGMNVGLNLGKSAGAGIADHLHFHLIPRWDGDTNFTTVVSQVRVIPERLEDTYKRLKPYFKVLRTA
ncbi:MAG: HIT domain-containing protein [Nitrospirota bacterium]